MGTDLGTCIAAIAPVTGIIVGALTCRECQPYRWDDEGRWIVYEYADARPVTRRWGLHMDLFSHDDLRAGDVNCRYTAMVEDETEDRCAPLMRYGLSGVEELFLLNPVLRGDCSNIKYNTPYCTDGCKFNYCFPVLQYTNDSKSDRGLKKTNKARPVLEPLRAYDGFCGPPHNNATCRGVDHGQCCNSETWRCGQSE